MSNAGMNRRHFMKHVAAYSALAVPGIQFVRTLQANAQQMQRNNKSVIIMYMNGGPATIDIWDLKPNHPNGGEFRPINTSANGVQISEHMPITAQQMHRLAIIRSLTTNEGDHNRGRQLMHTSYTPNPAIDFPSLGAVVTLRAPTLPGFQAVSLPGYIAVGGGAGGGGFLGMNYAPFTVQNPGTPPENIRPPQGVTQHRMQRRNRLFWMFEDQFSQGQAPHLNTQEQRATFADGSLAHSEVYGKGFALTASGEGNIFDLRNEPASVTEAYGNSNFGRSALLARRLVEAGVSSVEISMGGWDTHNGNFNALRTNQLPTLDRAMGNLVRELNERGLWQNTALVWIGDFGRTPRINQNAGRDHWPRCWSVVIGGGAIQGGRVHGSTTNDGMAVDQNPATVGDLFATVYQALGIDPSSQVRDPIGRPFNIAGQGGQPIQSLL
jgi:hypothetical protein